MGAFDDVINPGARAAVEQLHREFSSATPFRHVLIESFFRESVCDAILAQFPKPEPDKMLNEFGTPNKKMARHDVRNIGEVFRKLDDCVRSPEFAEFMSALTGIPDLLYDPEYHGAGTHDNFDGQGMDPHVDFNLHRTTGHHRRINAIIYLNGEWKDEWGGSLDLHKDPWDPARDWRKRYTPLKNRCVLFETNEYSWHGFEPIRLPPDKRHLSRKSFTIYMYTKDRPREEIADKHGTIYVQRPLPSYIEPGYTLTQSDVDELRANFTKRNAYLKGLYAREAELQKTVLGLRAQNDTFQRLLRLPVLGYVGATKRPEGMWPNFGVGRRLRAPLRAVRPIQRIRLRGRLPEYLSQNTLTLTIDDTVIAEATVGSRIDLVTPPVGIEGEFVLGIDAAEALSPVAAGVSADRREFAFFVDALEFEHGVDSGGVGAPRP
jgi:Rps23 Pro-64 3,4-dihydroxylase Tpa1-like proline 4-hydroxylase